MEEEKYIKRCFELALLGSGRVSPNPMVGCVIVYNGKIIGEGFHKQYGKAHAEVNAINSVKDKSLLEKSTIYVSLEPCCHYGKTPPCANLILEKKIPKVVISNFDPNPKVFGGGIKILRDGGVEVITGILEKEGKEINKRFFTSHILKRPYITLKWAQTLDSYMDIEREKKVKSYWITNDNLRVWVHKQRAFEDAMLVGKNTVINDNPNLNIRYYSGKNPLRLVIDRNLEITKDYKVMDKKQKTIIFNSKKNHIEDENLIYNKLDFNDNIIPQLLSYLHSIKVKSIIVEGGKNTLESFINSNLWDEANVLVGNKFFHKGLRACNIEDVYLSSREDYADNYILNYRNRIYL